MPRREVPIRNNSNNIQTFNFYHDPHPQNPILYQRCNLLDHDVVNFQTQQLKQHKASLRKFSQPQIHKTPILVQSNDRTISKKAHRNNLAGQLEETGTAFFVREHTQNRVKCSDQPLIAKDCSFLHNNYASIGTQNQFCEYPRGNMAKLLKQQYDMKHTQQIPRKIYCFSQISCKKPIK